MATLLLFRFLAILVKRFFVTCFRLRFLLSFIDDTKLNLLTLLFRLCFQLAGVELDFFSAALFLATGLHFDDHVLEQEEEVDGYVTEENGQEEDVCLKVKRGLVGFRHENKGVNEDDRCDFVEDV